MFWSWSCEWEKETFIKKNGWCKWTELHNRRWKTDYFRLVGSVCACTSFSVTAHKNNKMDGMTVWWSSSWPLKSESSVWTEFLNVSHKHYEIPHTIDGTQKSMCTDISSRKKMKQMKLKSKTGIHIRNASDCHIVSVAWNTRKWVHTNRPIHNMMVVMQCGDHLLQWIQPLTN